MLEKEFFKSIMKAASLKLKSKVPSEDYISLWLSRLTFYLIIYIILILLSILIFSKIGLFNNNLDNARYMLSAIIQSEAAIIAIVITLSLIAIQLSAQSYSISIMDIFKKSPDLWILLGIYLFSMIYQLGVLKIIEEIYHGHITFSFFMGIFSFVVLLPYLWSTLNLLRPSTGIDIFSKKISKQNILSAIDGKSPEKKDPVQPIIYIIRGSIMKYDYETTKYGLKVIGDQIKIIFENEKLNREEEKRISKHLFDHLIKIGKLAAYRDDEYSTSEVLIIMKKSGIIAINKQLNDALNDISSSILHVGKAATKQKFENATFLSAFFLAEIGKLAVENKNYLEIVRITDYLGKIGEEAICQKMEVTTKYIAGYLVGFGKISSEKISDDVTNKIVITLGKIGITSIEQKLDEATLMVAKSLRSIRVFASINRQYKASGNAKNYLEEMLRIAEKNEMEIGNKIEDILR